MNKAGTSLMTEEQYLESKGFGMTSLGDFGLHRYPRRPSKSQERSTQKLTLQRQNEWQEQRNKLRDEYRQKVQEGEVRPPSRVEKLLQTARGMPDNSAVQAARRILRGMGLWNDEMERESDMNKIAVAKELVAVARMISGASPRAKQIKAVRAGLEKLDAKLKEAMKLAESLEGEMRELTVDFEPPHSGSDTFWNSFKGGFRYILNKLIYSSEAGYGGLEYYRRLLDKMEAKQS